MADPATPSRRADLGTRLASAAVMIALAGTALYLGGPVLTVFIALIGLGLLWEWWNMVSRFAASPGVRIIWMAGGVAYVGAACLSLILMPPGLRWIVILAVIAVDSGAYFSGRRFGGRKIAPSISPSKTWAGLYGGMAGASLVMLAAGFLLLFALSSLAPRPSGLGDVISRHPGSLLLMILAGCLLAVLAQAGDFFESWMKRRAGLKDSGSLIPGHGGLFDRVDGLIPVAIAAGILSSVKLG